MCKYNVRIFSCQDICRIIHKNVATNSQRRFDWICTIPQRRTYWLVRTQCGKYAVFLHSSPILLDKSIRAYKNRAMGVNVVSVGSPSRIRIVRRISFGITTRPRSSIRLTIPVAFMFRTSFLAAAGASRIPVRALRKGFLHSRKGGSRPLCPHGRPIAAWWGTWLLFEKATGIIPCAHILSGMVPNSAYPAV